MRPRDRSSRPISFRLDARYERELRRRAEGARISPGDYARLVLIRHIEDTELANLRDEVASLRSELERFRTHFAAVVEE